MKNRTLYLLLVLALGSFVLSVSSCACWTDESKKNTPGCFIAHAIIDCTVDSVKGSLPYFARIVGSLINGGIDPNNIPWDDIVKQAEGMGIKDGGCFLAELKNLFFGPAAEEPMRMAMGSPMASTKLTVLRQKVSDELSAYKVKHFGTANVHFRIKDASGKVVEL